MSCNSEFHPPPPPYFQIITLYPRHCMIQLNQDKVISSILWCLFVAAVMQKKKSNSKLATCVAGFIQPFQFKNSAEFINFAAEEYFSNLKQLRLSLGLTLKFYPSVVIFRCICFLFTNSLDKTWIGCSIIVFFFFLLNKISFFQLSKIIICLSVSDSGNKHHFGNTFRYRIIVPLVNW